MERFFGRGSICVFATVVFTCAGVGGVSLYRDRLLINVSGSVPLGLYVRSDPSVAEFATICLPELPVWVGYDSILCSADNPSGIPVIKRIVAKVDRGMILRGDGTFPLDSRVFGPVSPERMLGFWRPVVTLAFLPRNDVPRAGRSQSKCRAQRFFRIARLTDPGTALLFEGAIDAPSAWTLDEVVRIDIIISTAGGTVECRD